MFDPSKPGWKTTEFQITIVILALANTIFHHKLSQENVIGTIDVIVPAAYILSRTCIKVMKLWQGKPVVPVTPLPIPGTTLQSVETSTGQSSVSTSHTPGFMEEASLVRDEILPSKTSTKKTTSRSRTR